MKRLDLLNKLDKQAFQQYCSRNFLKWCRLVTERETQGVDVVDMAAFAAGGMGLAVSGLQ